MLQIGIKGTATTMVDETNTAKTIGSGALEVFATPAMIALMEKSACNCINDYLDEDSGSVGTLVNITHVSATAMGVEVEAVSELTEIDGRKLVFTVTATDKFGVIGKGTHERFIINNDKFMAKLNLK